MTSTPAGASRDVRRVQWLLFAAAWIAFSYFHQGGGWNQNARFALVRAIVEEGRLSIDSHLVYARTDGGRLVRVPITGGRFSHGGQEFALWWRDPAGRPVPLDGRASGSLTAVDPAGRTLDLQVGRDALLRIDVAPGVVPSMDGHAAPLEQLAPGARVDASVAAMPGGLVATGVTVHAPGRAPDVVLVEPEQVAATGDVSWARGHFHPNKAPGTSFLAIPAYFLLHQLDRLAGLDPDEVSTLTRNAWLTSALSVGLFAAFACTLFFRLGLELSGGRALPGLLATLTFAFGTLYLPYGTMLHEHDVIAAALVTSVYLLHRAGTLAATDPAGRLKARRLVLLGGLCAGYAAITNYVVAGVVLMLGAYVISAVRLPRGWAWFSLGVVGPFLLICGYNLACFSTPFTTNYAHENPAFRSGDAALLGVFLRPSWDVLVSVLVSPYRGLLFSAPVLSMGTWGLVVWVRRPETRRLAWLSVCVVAFFLLVVTTFNGWHGGWAVGPRYLVPAVPFLALPLVAAFDRFPRLTSTLAAVSAASMLLVTAVDPQAPQDIRRPLSEYVWPLFSDERATPLLRAGRDEALHAVEEALTADGVTPADRSERLASFGAQLDASIRAGDPAPLRLATGPDGRPGLALSDLPTLEGPVSVNPIGFYEGSSYRLFARRSPEVRWNSFNAGELLLGRRRSSLLPLLALCGALAAAAIVLARRHDGRPSP